MFRRLHACGVFPTRLAALVVAVAVALVGVKLIPLPMSHSATDAKSPLLDASSGAALVSFNATNPALVVRGPLAGAGGKTASIPTQAPSSIPRDRTIDDPKSALCATLHQRYHAMGATSNSSQGHDLGVAIRSCSNAPFTSGACQWANSALSVEAALRMERVIAEVLTDPDGPRSTKEAAHIFRGAVYCSAVLQRSNTSAVPPCARRSRAFGVLVVPDHPAWTDPTSQPHAVGHHSTEVQTSLPLPQCEAWRLLQCRGGQIGNMYDEDPTLSENLTQSFWPRPWGPSALYNFCHKTAVLAFHPPPPSYKSAAAAYSTRELDGNGPKSARAKLWRPFSTNGSLFYAFHDVLHYHGNYYSTYRGHHHEWPHGGYFHYVANLWPRDVYRSLRLFPVPSDWQSYPDAPRPAAGKKGGRAGRCVSHARDRFHVLVPPPGRRAFSDAAPAAFPDCS